MSRQRVGLVGGDGLAGAVEAAGGDPVVAEAAAMEEVAVVVADGEAAVVDLARAGVDAPVLPVAAGAGLRSVPRERAAAAIDRILGGECPTERHPVVAAAGGPRAVFDVALMAAEPARISEFSVRSAGESVARFRADGVVASTPAGSAGYNRAADGPVVAPGADVMAVVPIAPFATDADRWVLPTEGLTLAVEREDPPVELLADGRIERSVAAGDPIALGHADDVETLVVPEAEPFF